MLSIILTSSVLYPDISSVTIIAILVGGSALGISVAAVVGFIQAKRNMRLGSAVERVEHDRDAAHWRMPPLAKLKPMNLTLKKLVWLGVLRGYLIVAMFLIAYKIATMTMG
ncbi:MAG: hypothetical protein NVSMB6_23670 [Burkholderiaceae bacterium]